MKLTEKLENLEFYAIAASKYLTHTLKSSTIKKYSKEVKRALITLEIIKDCLVSEFKLFEKDGKYFILFYFDELHELTFKLKNKEEFDLLKEELL